MVLHVLYHANLVKNGNLKKHTVIIFIHFCHLNLAALFIISHRLLVLSKIKVTGILVNCGKIINLGLLW